MSSFRQIAANRRNSSKSTGPRAEEGKQRARSNAVRHGLTAETVISALEDAEDYTVFEAAITADYDAQSAVERVLVLRLASLLWRLRRAIETGLFEIKADYLAEVRKERHLAPNSRQIVYALFGQRAVRTATSRRRSQAAKQKASVSAAQHLLKSPIALRFELAVLLTTSQPAEFRARSSQSLRSRALAPGSPDALDRCKPGERRRRPLNFAAHGLGLANSRHFTFL
jgi:hypothetical protein